MMLFVLLFLTTGLVSVHSSIFDRYPSGVLCASPLPPSTVKKISESEARKILAKDTYDRGLASAIYWLLGSDEPENRKEVALLRSFCKKEVVLAYRRDTLADCTFYNALKLCARKLKSPNTFFLALSKSPLYIYKEDLQANNILCIDFVRCLNNLQNPDVSIIKLAEKLAENNELTHLVLPLLAFKADEGTLRKTVERIVKTPKLHRSSITDALCEYRYRPANLAGLIAIWKAKKLHWEQFDLITTLDKKHGQYSRATTGDYKRTAGSDAKTMLSLLEEVVQMKEVLRKSKFPTTMLKEGYANLEKIRKVLEKKLEEYEKNRKDK